MSPHSGAHQSGYDSINMGHAGHNMSLFDDKKIRSNFVSKVFSILFAQLIVATGLIAWFNLHQPTKDYLLKNGAFYLYGAFALFMVVYLIVVCIESARRSFPLNFILLALLTVSYGMVAAIMSSRYSQNAVLCAFGSTALAVLVIILMAKYSPFDMTQCGCGLCILGLVHLVVSTILIIALVPTYASTVSLIVAGSGAFLVSLYMVFDLQLIMGGRRNELSPEEYILATVLLYIDILMLFQYLLMLFARD